MVFKRANDYKKAKYKVRAIGDLNSKNDNEVWTAKIDGAHTVIEMNEGNIPKHFSHRISKRTNQPIDYTEKLPHVKTTSKYNALLRGETYAVDKDNKAVDPSLITALLNSKTQRSLETQEQLGIKTRTALIDLDKFNDQDMKNASFKKKREILDMIAKDHPEYDLPDTAYKKREKDKLLKKIVKHKHPQTKEGIVVHDKDNENQPFIKSKIIDHHDVYVRNIFEEKNTKGSRQFMAGGFDYSWSPNGKIVGKVGSGFSHEEKVDMIKNPDKYKGRVALVKALGTSKNKALLKPSFDGWHVDKNLIDTDKVANYKELIHSSALEKIASNKLIAPGISAAALLGGLLATKSQYDKGNITGRETLWHSTSNENAKKILREGLSKSKAMDKNNPGYQVLKKLDIQDDEIKNKIYLAKKDYVAREIEPGPRSLFKLKVPLRKMTTTTNPSVNNQSSLSDYLMSDNDKIRNILIDRQSGKIKKDLLKIYKKIDEDLHLTKEELELFLELENAVDSNMKSQIPDAIENWKRYGTPGTVVVEEDISPKYIKKHINFTDSSKRNLKSKKNPGYEKTPLSEIVEFAKNNPHRFAKGTVPIGVALGGLGGLGLSLLKKGKI